MSQHKFLCKNCRKVISVSAKAIGQRANCCLCGFQQVVPTADDDAAFRASLDRALAALMVERRRRDEAERIRKEEEKRRLAKESARQREEERRRQEEQKRRCDEEKAAAKAEEAKRQAAAKAEELRGAEIYTRLVAGVHSVLPVPAQQSGLSPGGESDRMQQELEKLWNEVKDKAQQIVDERTERHVTYQIAQVLEDRELCHKGNYVPGDGWYFDGAQFSLAGIDTRRDADEEVYTADLYFAGTYTFTTVEGLPRTVPEYAINREYAVGTVIKHFGLLPEQFWEGAQSDITPFPPDGQMRLNAVRSCGTGFAITQEGHIVTNYHVIKGGNSIRVKTAKDFLPADIIAADAGNDLAMLKINAKTDCVVFSSARTAQLGQTVFTVGFPMPDVQGFSPKVTKGVISGLKGIKDDVRNYQIDAAVQPGNSGGPLADDRGRVVGVVVARLSDRAIMAEQGIVPQNVNYAVKLAYLEAMIDASPKVAKGIRTANDDAQISFEAAVAKVAKSTVMIAVY